VKLVFAGTRGYIKLRTPQHCRHSLLLLQYRRKTLLIDCGEDWLDHLAELDAADAVVITHAHPDHAGGLKKGWDRSVWATAESWQTMARYPLAQQEVLVPRSPTRIAGMTVEAFRLVHSILAPAVGLRIQAGRRTIFYVPDVLWINESAEALAGVDLYVGDAATLRRGLVRKRGDTLIGHAAVSTQLGWCARAGIRRAVFSHCGSEVVRDHEEAARLVATLGEARGVRASIAVDGQVEVI